MYRRRFLTAAATAALAGCSSTDAPDSTADGSTATPTATSTPTVTATARSTTSHATATPTATATPRPSPDGVVTADYEPIREHASAYFRWYSLERCQVVVRPDDFPAVDGEMKPVVFAQSYPSGSILDTDAAAPRAFDSGEQTLTLEYALDPDPDERFFLGVTLVPPEESLTASGDDRVFLCETDRLARRDGALEKSPHPAAKPTLETDGYARFSGEGLYAIDLRGAVNFGLTVYKHAYVYYDQQPTREIETIIRRSATEGMGQAFAAALREAASAAGRSTRREQVNYAVDVIQAFPYVADSVETPYDNYNKYPVETLVESGGDCEDTSILLASALLADPYGYGCALVYLPAENPTHVGLGVRGGDGVSGHYYTLDGTRYYYTETTGEGWAVGDLPSEYRGLSARLVPLT